MSDCGCKDKAKKRGPAIIVDPAKQIVKPSRLTINCVCGQRRTLPADLEEGDVFDMTPCFRCGLAFRGRLTRFGVLELDEGIDLSATYKID